MISGFFYQKVKKGGADFPAPHPEREKRIEIFSFYIKSSQPCKGKRPVAGLQKEFPVVGVPGETENRIIDRINEFKEPIKGIGIAERFFHAHDKQN